MLLGDADSDGRRSRRPAGRSRRSASQRIACRRSPDWRRMKLTVFSPSAKSCEMTARKTSTPGRVSSAEREPDAEAVDEAVRRRGRPRRARRPGAWARACSGVVAVVQDEDALGEEEDRGSRARRESSTRCGVADRLDASGRTSKSATATTTPPVSAIGVCRSRRAAARRGRPRASRATVSPRERDRDPGHAQLRQVP